MIFGRMCHQWWSHLFLIGSLTSIQQLLGFQRKCAERKFYTRHARSQVCAFHVVPYTKMIALVFDWQPQAYNLHASSNNLFFFSFDFLKCYFRVNIFTYSSHTVSN